jgi:hypothetical protein
LPLAVAQKPIYRQKTAAPQTSLRVVPGLDPIVLHNSAFPITGLPIAETGLLKFRLEEIILLQRTLAMMLFGIVIAMSLCFQSVGAQTAGEAEARAKVQKLGVGRDARVEVRLKDDTKLKGYVSAAELDSFTVTDPKSGAPTTVAYAEVAQMKKRSGGLSTKSWLIIGGVAAGATITWIAVKPALCDGGAQSRFPC